MKKNMQIFVCAVIICVVAVIYIVRLGQWQLVQGENFAEQSASSSELYVSLDAARGEILDKDGNVLVGNTNIYNISLNAITMGDDRNPTILNTITVLEYMGQEWIDELPIYVNSDGTYSFIAEDEDEIAYLKGENMLDIHEGATAQECMEELIGRYNCEEYNPWQARDIVSVRYNMTIMRFSLSDPYVIASDVSLEAVEMIKEQTSDLPGIEVEISTKRNYIDGTTAPHIVGTMGAVTQEQYDRFVEEDKLYSSDNPGGYLYSDITGQSGIEHYYEDILRGTRGLQTAVYDDAGNMTGMEMVSETEPGDNVYLTIDSTLQQVATFALQEAIEEADNPDFKSGAVVVLDVETFGVLAAATYPTFDLELYESDELYYNSLFEDEDLPLFNRAINGAFTPGSVMKPATAITALEENIVNDSFTYTCNGSYDHYPDSPIGCLGYHGDVNVYDAMAHSCNEYFAELGRITGIQRLEVYYNLLGLGTSTGIEIYENVGNMTNPDDYEAIHNTPWVDGITSHASIGQADDSFTPLQIATYTATIANDGVRLQTHLTDKITDYLGEETILDYEPVVMQDTGISQYNIDIVQEAMRQVASSGYTAVTFRHYPIEIAAKTGTAETDIEANNSLFIGYAPYDNPEIAVAVVLEYASSSVTAQSIAKQVLDYYFYDTIPWNFE